MAISFDKALGIHQQALGLRVNRAEMIANNLANADTPGFKARDIDFKSALADATKVQAGDALSINTTHQGISTIWMSRAVCRSFTGRPSSPL